MILERSRGIALKVWLEDVVYGCAGSSLLTEIVLRARILTLVRFSGENWSFDSSTSISALAPGVQSYDNRPLEELEISGWWVPQVATLLGPQTTRLVLSKCSPQRAVQLIEFIHLCPNLRQLDIVDVVLGGTEATGVPRPLWRDGSVAQRRRFLRRLYITASPALNWIILHVLLAYPQTLRHGEDVYVYPKPGSGADGAAACAQLLTVDSWELQYRQKLTVVIRMFGAFNLEYLVDLPETGAKSRRRRKFLLDSGTLKYCEPLKSGVAQTMQDLVTLEFVIPVIWLEEAPAFMDIWPGAIWPALQTLVLRSSGTPLPSAETSILQEPQATLLSPIFVPTLQIVSLRVAWVQGGDPALSNLGDVTKKWATMCWRILGKLKFDHDAVVIGVASDSSVVISESLQPAIVVEQIEIGAAPLPIFVE